MRKLVIFCFIPTLIISCGGGGSGTQTSSDVNGNTNVNGTPPSNYIESLTNGGKLTSITNLEVMDSSTNTPLQFAVESITNDTTVTFSITPAHGLSGAVPSLNTSSCRFSQANPQPCKLLLNSATAPDGKYIITPNDGSPLSPIDITTMKSGTILLNGTYSSQETMLDYQCNYKPISYEITANNTQICITMDSQTTCKENKLIPIPSGVDPFFSDGSYVFNVKYFNGTLSLYFMPTYCPGAYSTAQITKISNNTTVMQQPTQNSSTTSINRTHGFFF